MNKFFIVFLLLMIIAPLMLFSLTDKEIAKDVTGIKDVAIGIFDVGFVNWIKVNWWIFILALVGAGRLFVFISPSKKDDEWYGKYINKPIRYIGTFISLGIAKDRGDSG